VANNDVEMPLHWTT